MHFCAISDALSALEVSRRRECAIYYICYWHHGELQTVFRPERYLWHFLVISQSDQSEIMQFEICSYLVFYLSLLLSLPDLMRTRYHRLRGSDSTVATMTSKVSGTMEISTPCRSETPENIETKIGRNDYVMDPFNPANFRINRSNGVRSPYSWNITLNCVIPFLSFPFLFFLVVAYSKNWWTAFTIYTSNDASSPKGVPFGGFDEKKNRSGYQNPITPPPSGRG